MHVASLDFGTTGCRTTIFDLTGNIVSSDYREYPSIYPSPSFVEQDANLWWISIKDTIKNSISKSGIDSSEIVSCSITNQISV
jgi:glycerol kinase